MKLHRLAVAVAFSAVLMSISKTTGQTAVTHMMELPFTNILLGFGMGAMKLTVAGRLLGIISDWFINRPERGVTVTKEIVSLASRDGFSEEASAAADDDDNNDEKNNNNDDDDDDDDYYDDDEDYYDDDDDYYDEADDQVDRRGTSGKYRARMTSRTSASAGTGGARQTSGRVTGRRTPYAGSSGLRDEDFAPGIPIRGGSIASSSSRRRQPSKQSASSSSSSSTQSRRLQLQRLQKEVQRQAQLRRQLASRNNNNNNMQVNPFLPRGTTAMRREGLPTSSANASTMWRSSASPSLLVPQQTFPFMQQPAYNMPSPAMHMPNQPGLPAYAAHQNQMQHYDSMLQMQHQQQQQQQQMQYLWQQQQQQQQQHQFPDMYNHRYANMQPYAADPMHAGAMGPGPAQSFSSASQGHAFNGVPQSPSPSNLAYQPSFGPNPGFAMNPMPFPQQQQQHPSPFRPYFGTGVAGQFPTVPGAVPSTNSHDLSLQSAYPGNAGANANGNLGVSDHTISHRGPGFSAHPYGPAPPYSYPAALPNGSPVPQMLANVGAQSAQPKSATKKQAKPKSASARGSAALAGANTMQETKSAKASRTGNNEEHEGERNTSVPEVSYLAHKRNMTTNEGNATVEANGASNNGQHESSSSSSTTPAPANRRRRTHRVIARDVRFADTNAKEETQNSGTPTTSTEMHESPEELITEYFSRIRSLDRTRCVLKMVCYMGADENRFGEYGRAVARFFSVIWEKYRNEFLGRLLGYDEAFRMGRTHGHEGCVLKYNSCPMNVVNLVFLATNLERSQEQLGSAHVTDAQVEAVAHTPISEMMKNAPTNAPPATHDESSQQP